MRELITVEYCDEYCSAEIVTEDRELAEEYVRIKSEIFRNSDYQIETIKVLETKDDLRYSIYYTLQYYYDYRVKETKEVFNTETKQRSYVRTYSGEWKKYEYQEPQWSWDVHFFALTSPSTSTYTDRDSMGIGLPEDVQNLYCIKVTGTNRDDVHATFDRLSKILEAEIIRRGGTPAGWWV